MESGTSHSDKHKVCRYIRRERPVVIGIEIGRWIFYSLITSNLRKNIYMNQH